MSRPTLRSRFAWRLRAQDGYTMLLALAILTITMLLTGALLLAVQSDAYLTHDDLDGKRAYSAAQAGLQAYLFNLNHNSAMTKYWQTCSNDSSPIVNGVPVPTAVPGNSDESYTFKPVVTCSSTKPVGTVLDPTTGQLRLEFTGASGTATRTVVAAFRTLSPLSYLWYTVHETKDPLVDPGADCSQFYYQSPSPAVSCHVHWVTGDHMNGPMYTQDSYVIAGHPTFGRTAADTIASNAPFDTVCVKGTGGGTSGGTGGGGDGTDGLGLTGLRTLDATAPTAPTGILPITCPAGVLVGTGDPDAPLVQLPSDNGSLRTDAQSNGVVLSGTTTLTFFSGTQAKAITCTGRTAGTCSSKTINLAAEPIIFDATDTTGTTPGPCSSSYNGSDVPAPATVSYKGIAYPYGNCGDVYLQAGSYSTPVTIAAENDIIIQGNVLDSSVDVNGNPTGTATLGLIADQWVRVGHPTVKPGSGCTAANPNRTIDAAILTLAHSFMVDNYTCGGASFGTLTVNGAIAQMYRGIVGYGAGAIDGGYVKAYSYDNRLAYQLPPYMFDLQDASWQIARETLCALGQPKTSPQSCGYGGTSS